MEALYRLLQIPTHVILQVRTTPGKILGYDATGIVEAAGSSALFKSGDEVFYAGSATRAGSNSELQLVDSRIVARKPRNLAWDDAAAIPLVGLTAWEMLEEKFHLAPSSPGGDNKDLEIIVVNAAGGVGTMALFLAAKVRLQRSALTEPSTSKNQLLLTTFAAGFQHRSNHRNSITPRDYRMGQEVRCHRCHQPSRASWTSTRSIERPTIARIPLP